jgi:outer membrane protein
MIKGFLKRGILSLLIVLLSCALAASENTGTERLTLEKSIETALERSVIIHSAREDVKASEAGKKKALTSFLPTLSTSYTYARLNETPEAPLFDLSSMGMKTAPVGTKDNYTWEMELAQPIFTGGALVNSYEINSIELDISRIGETATIQDIVLEVRNGYFNILKAKRILEVAQQSTDQLKAHRDTAQSFYDVGIIPKNDLLYAEVQLANGQQELVRAENALQMAVAKFNMVLRRDIGLPLEVEDILTYRPFEKNFDECLKLGLKKRPEIRIYELRNEQAKSAVKLAKSDFFPSLNFVANYSKYGDDPGVKGSEYQDQEDWYVAAVANWNFWEWGRTKHSVDANKSREKQAMDALIIIKDQVALQINNAYLLLKEAEKRIIVTEKAIEQAEENFRINGERYREQVATSTDVIDAQTLLTKTKSDYYNALSDYNIALGKLERSMGIIYISEEPKVSAEK